MLANRSNAAAVVTSAAFEERLGGLGLSEAFPTSKLPQWLRQRGEGDFGRVDALIAKGVDVNYQGTQGITPIAWFVAAGDVLGAGHFTRGILVVFILMVEATMSASFAEGRFGGMTAREAFSDARVTALVEAGQRGDLEQVDASIRAGVNVNAVGAQGATPLTWLLATRNKEVLGRLLQAGADPNYKGFGGADESAMSLAAGGNNPALLELLLNNRGDPNIIGPNNKPALHIAALQGRWGTFGCSSSMEAM